jgi:hypothetical protein
MPLGECGAGTRFQIPLERQRPCLVAKCDHDVEFPWAMSRRVDKLTSVMREQSSLYVGRDASVVAISIAEAPEHVDESFRRHYDGAPGNVRAEANR